MSDTTKVENWAFPFKTAGEASQEVTDPQLYYDALAKARSGFYPLGANGLWHGGVHFDQGTGALLNQSEVRCIADGEVIAYRIDERYPETLYGAIVPGNGPEPLGAKFSTGFVLVKHRLELPAMPPTTTPATGDAAASPAAATPPAAAAPGDSAPAPEALTFYSLYMHLLDWAGYQAATAPKPPVFLAPSQYSVKHTSDDPLSGLRVRALHDDGMTGVLALLPKGCKVTLGEAHSIKPQFKQLLSVDEGAAVPALPAGATGWVYTAELTGNTVADKAQDTEPALTLSHQGLRVRKEGNRNGAIIGVLPRGATLKVGEKRSGGYCKVLEVMDYRGVPALPNGPDGKPLGYVYFDELETKQTAPSDLGHVHLLPEPHAIKAGELIGHIGLYQDHDESTPKPRLHLEVFSCEDVPAFIAKSRARAASLPAEQKTLLKIHKGASKLIPHRTDFSASNPPKITDTGVTIAVERTIPVSVLESLPAERKIQVSEAVPGSTTPRITHWWRLDNLLADEAGKLISGWLAEQELITTRHSPWEWEGFDFISETTCAADHLACHLAAERLLTEAEQPDYQAQISTADHGPIKTRLYDIIDGADGSTRDKKLSVREIRAALSKPWHAQSISRLITHYESEWFWKEGKWDELDKLMEHTEEDPNPQWVREKERIKKLSWWSELAGKQGTNADGRVWHFQPAGMVFSFGKLDDENDLKWLKVPKGQLTFDVEGNDIVNSIHFSRVVHWPKGPSGVTIGRGYDLGQRPNPEADLTEAGVPEPLFSWLINAKGLKGQAAKSYLDAASEEIRQFQITRKQQYKLFIPVYEFMKSEVIRISGSPANIEDYGALTWETTDSKIQDIAVDLIYRGDYTPNTRKLVQQYIVDNDLPALSTTIADSSKWPGVPSDRFNRRASYLR
ncbi:hypothetical protein ACSX1C_15135 [Pseudomonas sp. MBLB4123]|uniref:hypothetical protein n=1 Tax=Pseudomonas sp. MBLB4123 TaxID=3451557 RepID=UPI003F7536B2